MPRGRAAGFIDVRVEDEAGNDQRQDTQADRLQPVVAAGLARSFSSMTSVARSSSPTKSCAGT
jgi:hypothetical protein